MSEPLTWSCSCGKVQGECVAGRGARIVCYCESCRVFVENQGAGDILDPAGGNDLYQTAPEAFHFTQGSDLLAWSKQTEKGPVRWFTTCCNSPLANTLGSPAIPFVSLQTAYFKDPAGAGKVTARVNRKGATGHIEGEMGSTGRMLLAFVGRMARSRLSGNYKKNPFFDAAGAPIGPRATGAPQAAKQS